MGFKVKKIHNGNMGWLGVTQRHHY